jgi:hypothetical protein
MSNADVFRINGRPMAKAQSEGSRAIAGTRDVRAKRYRSPAFHKELTALLGIGLSGSLAALLQTDLLPAGPDIPDDLAVSHEATFVLAAAASSLTHPASLTEAARGVLALDYQLEFGPKASDDRKGRRKGRPSLNKDYLGTHLATAFWKLARLRHNAVVHTRSFELTIGWNAFGKSVALVHYPERETTLVYTHGFLFPNLHPGIARMDHLEFELPVKLFLPAETIFRFGKLMQGGGDYCGEKPSDG